MTLRSYKPSLTSDQLLILSTNNIAINEASRNKQQLIYSISATSARL